jgi:hypothetical protein
MTTLRASIIPNIAQRLARTNAVCESPGYKHRVYVGGFHPHPDVMFIKVGMTSDVNLRIKAYAGMVPGGLSFMFTSTVETRGEAMKGEKKILHALAAHESFEAIGGEWFKCEPIMKGAAIDELLSVGRSFTQARMISPAPFTSAGRGRAKKGWRK